EEPAGPGVPVRLSERHHGPPRPGAGEPVAPGERAPAVARLRARAPAGPWRSALHDPGLRGRPRLDLEAPGERRREGGRSPAASIPPTPAQAAEMTVAQPHQLWRSRCEHQTT